LHFELGPQLGILFNQTSVLIINSLSNVRDQFQVVPQLVLFLLHLSSLVAFLGFFLFNLLLAFRYLALVFALELLKLLVLEAFEVVLVAIDVVVDFSLVLFLHRVTYLFVVLLETLAHTQLSLQIFYSLSVLKFIFLVPFSSADDLALLLFIGFLLLFNLLLQFEVNIVPVVVLDLAGLRDLELFHDDYRNCQQDNRTYCRWGLLCRIY